MFVSKRVNASAEQVASLRRKLCRVGEGVLTRRTMYFATVAWLTAMPSFNNSPSMRGAPHSGLALFICGSNHELRDLLTAVQTLSANANKAENPGGTTGPRLPASPAP